MRAFPFPPRPLPPRALVIGPPLLIAALVLAVWWPTLPWTFQFDDWAVVAWDPRVASLAAWWDAMPALRPVTKALYAAGNALGGEPWLFRGANLLLHAMNAALVYVLAKRLARRARAADERGSRAIGAVTAVIFALHPAQTESVTYVAGGTQVLCGSFVLLSLLAFLHAWDLAAARTGDERRLARVALIAACGICALLALGARETAAVLPIAALLWSATERGPRQRLPWVGAVLLMLVVGTALAFAWAHTAYPFLARTSLDLRPPLDNLGVATRGVFWLFGQLIRWDRFDVDPRLDVSDPWNAGDFVRAIALGLIVLVAAWQWRSRRWLSFGVLWLLLWLAPTHSLLARLDLANDRQLYLPLIGPAFVIAQAVQRIPRQSVWAVALLAATLAFATATRNQVYRDEVTFWTDALAKSPDNARAANNLGMAHAIACHPLAARAAFEEAARLAPEDPRAAINAELLSRGELPGVPEHCVGSARPP